MTLQQRYGVWSLVAGGSEGIGAAYANYLAASGINLILIARKKDPLEHYANVLREKYHVIIDTISFDLSGDNAAETLVEKLKGKEINILVYNAAISYIGPFEKKSVADLNALSQANIITPMNLVLLLAQQMLANKKGAVILMSSLAGFQGSGYLAAYAASKAFNRVLAESLWYEWKNKGVDVIACCAGATGTPNFEKTKPDKKDFFAPKVQSPDEVVTECFRHLGKRPSFISGRGNKIAGFIMQHLMPRKTAINVMGDTTRKMYRL